MKTLLIDDTKTLPADRIARNYADGIKALHEERWDLLLLDHDLGCFDENGKELTGMDILKWIAENRGYAPEKIGIVTMNIVARKQMFDFIEDNKL